ncbi:MAG: tail fiber assembly protein [Pluralibacter sp.]|nr:tail fiber assembly protein [Pluralibacter sp.]
MADYEIDWRQDAEKSGEATDNELSELAGWRNYRIMLMRVTSSNQEFPPVPA